MPFQHNPAKYRQICGTPCPRKVQCVRTKTDLKSHQQKKRKLVLNTKSGFRKGLSKNTTLCYYRAPLSEMMPGFVHSKVLVLSMSFRQNQVLCVCTTLMGFAGSDLHT